jgi:hypothetical protein
MKCGVFSSLIAFMHRKSNCNDVCGGVTVIHFLDNCPAANVSMLFPLLMSHCRLLLSFR